MKLCAPKVFLLGRSRVDEVGLADALEELGVPEWETDTGSDGEILVEASGRVCYLAFANPRPGGNRAYTANIIDKAHTSVLEHSVYTVLITGVSRSLTHELVRHRVGFSPSQLSQRYVDESVCEVVCPPALANEVWQAWGFLARFLGTDWKAGGEVKLDMEVLSAAIGRCSDEAVMAGLVWLRSMQQANEDYRYLSDYLTRRMRTAHAKAQEDNPLPGQKWVVTSPQQATEFRKKAREAARSVLPNATETKLSVTLNAQSARHLFYRRGSPHADAEIRRLAGVLFDVLNRATPNLFQDIEKVPLGDGTFHLKSPNWSDA